MDVDALMHEHKAKQLRQEMMKRQAELNALESQRRQREEQKQRELEVSFSVVSVAVMKRINLQTISTTEFSSGYTGSLVSNFY